MKLVIGGAASSLGIAMLRARPSEQKAKTPTISVTSSAGIVVVGIGTP